MELLKNKVFATHALAGVGSVALGTAVTYPLDTVKVIIQMVVYDPEKKTKPKGVLHWVAEPYPGVDPLKMEVRLFDRLFNWENLAELDDELIL